MSARGNDERHKAGLESVFVSIIVLLDDYLDRNFEQISRARWIRKEQRMASTTLAFRSLLTLLLPVFGAGLLRGEAAPALDEVPGLISKVQANPRDQQAWRNLGFAYYEQKQYKLAVEAYAKALALYPDDPAALSVQGDAYRLLGQPKPAISSLRAAIRLNPKYIPALFNLALVYAHNQDDKEAALLLLRRALASDPTPNQSTRIRNEIETLGGTKPFPARVDTNSAPAEQPNKFPPASDAVRVGNTYLRLIPPPKMSAVDRFTDPGQLACYSQRVRLENGNNTEPYWAEIHSAPAERPKVYTASEQKELLQALPNLKGSDWQSYFSKEEQATEKSMRDADIMDARVTMLKLDDMQVGANFFQFSFIMSIRNEMDESKELLVFGSTRAIFLKGKMVALRVYTNFTTLRDHLWARQTLRQWHQNLEAIN
jgi:tetratricopeptide (TPR) repeat protein